MLFYTNMDFLPGVEGQGFKLWMIKGIYTNKVLPFEEFKIKLHTPRTHFFEYLQQQKNFIYACTHYNKSSPQVDPV